MNNLKYRAFRIRDEKMYDVYNITFLINGVGCNARDENGEIGNTIGVNFNDCDPEFYLMQSTGQFDVNGKEIFVGDIVKIKIKGYSIPETGVIEYFDDYCMYSIQEPKRTYQKWVKRPIGKNGSSTKYTPFQWAYSFKSVEVVGNICENPVSQFIGTLNGKTDITSQEFIEIRKEEAKLDGGTAEDLQKMIEENKEAIAQEGAELDIKINKKINLLKKIEKLIGGIHVIWRCDSPRRVGAIYHIVYSPKTKFFTYAYEDRAEGLELEGVEVLSVYFFTQEECKKILNNLDAEELFNLFT